MQTFTEWALQTSSSSNVDPNQVICLGFNNSSFDDHFLLNHCQKKADPEVFALLRRKVFTADVRRMLKIKGKLSEAFVESGGSTEEAGLLHDALADCRALAVVMSHRKVSFQDICSNSRSLESVQQRRSNPLLKARLITDTVAARMPRQMTVQDYLSLSDEELKTMLGSLGLGQGSIKACLTKRKIYADRRL